MKVISKKELDRLRKKGGVKVKRHLGTKQKTPEPEVAASMPLSGSIPSKIPVPALPNSIPVPEPIAAPAPVIDMKPFAAMSASIAASNANVAKLIENNNTVIENFRIQLTEKVPEVKERVSWRHRVKRDQFKLMEEIISTPMRSGK